MDAANEIVDRWVSSERPYKGAILRATPFALEPDKYIDFGGVLISQPLSFMQVRLVSGPKCRQGRRRIWFKLQ